MAQQTQPPLQYAPAPGMPGVLNASGQPILTNNYNYGSDPIQVQCFHCQAIVTTRTIETPNVLCCFLFGCWAYCCPGCQDVEHRCPNCNVILGTYKA